MLRFKVFHNGTPAKTLNLEGSHLLGTDRVPLRAEIKFHNGEILCEPKARGAAALALMWPVKGLAEQAASPGSKHPGSAGEKPVAEGRMMLETTRLVERTRPYNLNVELARGHLMRISLKREDWGLYDYPEGATLYDRVDRARDMLVAAITATNEQKAAELGDAAVAASVRAGEAVATFHADVFLKRRIAAREIVKRPLGCCLDATGNWEPLVEPLSKWFDFAVVSFPWRALEPREGKCQPEAIEQCLQLLRSRKTAIWGRSLMSFQQAHLPEWLPGWADDYDRLRERVAKQIKAVLKQFGAHVRAWEVIGGIHAHNAFRFSFEQIMDLTRLSAILVKQMSPRSKALIGIVLPWGEYYAADSRTIPPHLYAEMAVESGINFDAFSLELPFGFDEGGLYVRDLMQVSALLDRFGSLGKPLHVTAVCVPSGGDATTQGAWRGRWSEQVQAQWLRAFYKIALSKPFVETVSWRAMSDASDVQHQTGFLRADLSPKPACQDLLSLRKDLRAGIVAQHPGGAPSTDGGI
jgi:hypothetical protein